MSGDSHKDTYEDEGLNSIMILMVWIVCMTFTFNELLQTGIHKTIGNIP